MLVTVLVYPDVVSFVLKGFEFRVIKGLEGVTLLQCTPRGNGSGMLIEEATML
jgi:hypothetical protein